MDQEVAKTLGELELKLQELEHELSSIGHRDTRPSPSDRPSQQSDKRDEPVHTPASSPADPPLAAGTLTGTGRLVDEAVERESEIAGSDGSTTPQSVDRRDDDEADVEETAVDNAFGGPGVWGGEEVPAQPGMTTERDWTVEVRETAYGEIPTPPPPQQDFGASHAQSWPPSQESRPPREPPLPPPLPQPHHPYASTPRETIDVEDLVRFKQKLQRTMDELIDEYSRLLPQRPPS